MPKAKESMPKFKDWMPGEARVTLKVITAAGTTMEFYIPHLTDEQGSAFIKLAMDAMHSPAHYAQGQKYFDHMADTAETTIRKPKRIH